MLQNYLKVAVRNLLKNPLYSGINLLGLTIGMTCFILIALYVQYELSYDTHHEKADRIYRVSQFSEGNFFQGSDRFAVSPLPMAQAIREEISRVEAATSIQDMEVLLTKEDQVFYERTLFADEYLFDVFTFPVVSGVGKEALQDPNSILLTESLAEKYFGDEAVIGRTILFQNDRLLTIKGIIKDIPENQHFNFDCITSIQNYPDYRNDMGVWISYNYLTYIALQEGVSDKEVERSLVALDKYAEAAYKDISGEETPPTLFLQPVKDIHLKSQINFEMAANSDIRYIYLFLGIAFIILLLASINYMNLATARSALRAKEIGMRKTLGAKRVQLLYQLLGESFLLTSLGFVLALMLVNILLPFYRQLLDLPIPFAIIGSRWVLVGMFLLAILIGGLSGLYPALFLSSASPVKALQGNFLKNYREGSSLRNLLIIGQFTTAVVLAIGAVVIHQQLQYIQNKKLGYDREQVVYVNYRDPLVFEKRQTLRTELRRSDLVEEVSFPSYMPLNMISQGLVDKWEGNTTKAQLQIYRNYVDTEFIDLFAMEIVEGRNFSAAFPTDTIDSYILNEAALRKLGWSTAVDKTFNGGKVIGVVKDFHFLPFNLEIAPIFLSYKRRDFGRGNVAIKIKGEDPTLALTHIQTTFKDVIPHMPIEAQFMDESYNRLYRAEKRFGQAFNIFTALALFLACMGLFGLVSHNVLQRTKEIGIRKVLGASVQNIVLLLSRDFIRLAAVSLLLAMPIAWYLMRQWLQNFEYRIEIRWWVFMLAGGVFVGLAFLTVSFQSIKAAVANPIDSLRTE